MPISQHPPADAADHRPVSPQELLERDGVVAAGEPAEQFAVGRIVPGRRAEPAGVVEHGFQRLRRHRSRHSGAGSLPIYSRETGRRLQLFSETRDRSQDSDRRQRPLE